MTQPESKLFCHGIMPPKQIVKLLLTDIEGDYLVGVRAKKDKRGGTLDFLGGAVEFGETLEAAAVREAMEEGGVQLEEQDLQIADVDMSYGSTGRLNVVTYFRGFLFDDPTTTSYNPGEMFDVFTMPGLEVLDSLEHADQSEVFTRHLLRSMVDSPLISA